MRPLLPLLLLALATPDGRSQETEVLYLGNSYTNAHHLAALVGGLAASGGHAYSSDQNTPGGNTLGAPQAGGAPHSTNAVSLAKIAGNDWEFVVLQDQSYLPTLPSPRADWMLPGVQSLAATIAANDPATRVLLFQTWGRRDAASFCSGAECVDFADFGAMQDELSEAYLEAAAPVGARVAPVGEAWRRVREQAPGLILHSADGSHPALAGSYLAACVFYTCLFDESPVGLAYTSTLDARTALFLQEVAAATVGADALGYCEAGPNSASVGGAALGYVGTSSLVAGDLSLVVSGAPPHESALCFYGPARTRAPFGDGTLCVDGPLYRLGSPLALDAQGGAVLHVDTASAPLAAGPGAAFPGVSWNFQCWFRDPAGPGGSGYNLTDGLAVTFRL